MSVSSKDVSFAIGIITNFSGNFWKILSYLGTSGICMCVLLLVPDIVDNAGVQRRLRSDQLHQFC